MPRSLDGFPFRDFTIHFLKLLPSACRVEPWERRQRGSRGNATSLREGGHSITLTNPAVPTIVLQYSAFKQITDDISDARVYDGIHFRTDQLAGEHLGKAVGKVVYRRNLRPIHDDD